MFVNRVAINSGALLKKLLYPFYELRCPNSGHLYQLYQGLTLIFPDYTQIAPLNRQSYESILPPFIRLDRTYSYSKFYTINK